MLNKSNYNAGSRRLNLTGDPHKMFDVGPLSQHHARL